MKKEGKIWGLNYPVFNKNNVEVHLLRIKKGGFCSKHLHKFKYNQFIVLEGKLQVIAWKETEKGEIEDVTTLEKGQELTIAPNEYHRFRAMEETLALECYWVELQGVDIYRLDQGGIAV